MASERVTVPMAAPADPPDADPRRALVHGAPVGLGWSDAAGSVVYANARWRELFDYEGDWPLPLRRVIELVHHDDREMLAERMLRSAQGDEVRVGVRTRDGRRHLSLSLSEIHDDPDGHIRFVGVVNDVTELVSALEEVGRSEQRFRTLTSALPIATFRTDPTGAITWANDRLLAMSGYTLDGMLGMSAFDVIHPDDREAAYQRALDAIVADESFESEHRFLCHDGSVRWIITRTTPIRDGRGRVTEHIGTMEDVTELHARTTELAEAAAVDPLTQLPNRATLESALDDLWAVRPGRRDIGVIFADLDGFKAVNDTYGHRAGDAVLVEVGVRLSAAIRADDIVSRFGGDEFVILCPGIVDPTVLDAVAERARSLIAEAPIEFEGTSHAIGVSVGTALGPAPGATTADLLHDADAAMYAAKRQGG